jgi:hypothetical protein
VEVLVYFFLFLNVTTAAAMTIIAIINPAVAA